MGVDIGSDSAAVKAYTLDLTRRSISQAIDDNVAAPHTRKFVKIDVTNVFNPHMIPLSFNVHYRTLQGEERLLGTFSLFPPDNPGSFLVATQGQLKTGGAVIVSLIPLEQTDMPKELRIQLKRLTFIH